MIGKPICIVLLIVLLACGCRAYCAPATTADVLACKLDCLAVLVEAASQGKTRILVGSGVDANPGGRPFRPVDFVELPFITVYPASSPESLKLVDVGWVKVLGAVRITAPAVGARDARAEPGVYLLVNLPESEVKWPAYTQTGKTDFALVSLAVGQDGKASLKSVLTITGTREEPLHLSILGDGPATLVRFPGDPLGQAIIELTWKESDGFHAYKCAIDLEVAFL